MGETVRQMWEDFIASVAHPQMPAVQYQEMRRAFYAGAYVMLQTVRATGEEHASETEAVAYLESLEVELRSFYRDVKEGRA